MTTSISPDYPLPNSIVGLLGKINAFSERTGLRYFMIGATARDVLMHHIHGLPIRRASLDVDFGMVVENWSHFQAIVTALLADKVFSQHPKIAHRFFFKYDDSIGGIVSLDLVPFGGIASEDGTIAWPPDMTTVMNVAGYEDALADAQRVRISEDVFIPICSVAGLTVTKLIAWIDRGSWDTKDAIDFSYLVQRYSDAGNADRLYGEQSWVLETCEYEWSLAGAMLLGMDVRAMASIAVRARLLSIFDGDRRLMIANQMMRQESEDRRGKVESHVDAFCKGLRDPVIQINS